MFIIKTKRKEGMYRGKTAPYQRRYIVLSAP